jgi:hypothetical protein
MDIKLTKSVYLLAVIILSMNFVSSATDVCSTYTCVTTLTKPMCGKETASVTPGINTYEIQYCDDKVKQTCDVNSLKADVTSVDCADRTATKKAKR